MSWPRLITTFAILILPSTALTYACSHLQPDDATCASVPCDRVYKVQKGDHCTSIEASFGLAENQLVSLNPGLSCASLAPSTSVCVQSSEAQVANTYTPPSDRNLALWPRAAAPESPVFANVSTESDARINFLIKTVFQSDSQQLAAFTQHDLNKDGKLDRSELQKMMSVDPGVAQGSGQVNNISVAGDIASEALRAADLNKDGAIDKSEFMRAVRQIQSTTNTMVNAASDESAAGNLSKRDQCSSPGISWWNVINPLAAFWIVSQLESCGIKKAPKPVGIMRTKSDPASARCGSDGCNSTCYNFVPDSCGCDRVEFEAIDKAKYVDNPYSTTIEKGTKECQTKCSSSGDCVGFSISSGASDKNISCKLYKTLTDRKSSENYITFRLRKFATPTGVPVNGKCPSLCGTEFTFWSPEAMADDYASGEKLTNEYTAPASKKRAAQDSVDRRGDPNFATTVKSQQQSACGLCAAFSFTTAVEGTHKVWKQGYRDSQDLSPIWVGRCKGKQSCEPKSQGGRHADLIKAVGDSSIHLEKCNPQSTVKNPDCQAKCGARTDKLPYITSSKEWNFRALAPDDSATRKKYLEEIKTWLRETGPIMASMCSGEAWTEYVNSLKSNGPDTTFYNGDPRWKNLKACGSCNHGITVVGYKHEKRGGRDRLVWIIQNSYGTTYGKGGYQLIENGSAAVHTTSWFGVKVDERPVSDEF